MSEAGQVRFDWREGLALLCALGRGALDSDPGAESLPVRALIRTAACHRAGGVEAFGRLPRHLREKLLGTETRAVRSALVRLGDLGLVVWDYSTGDDALTYRLTERGWETALCFGRRVVREHRATSARPDEQRSEIAAAAGT